MIQAHDPVAVAMAFALQIRVVVATLFGIRKCDEDVFGSSSEHMGGTAGRSDGFIGAVECQTSTGSLLLHFRNFIQRAHQHLSVRKIAKRLEEELLACDDLKSFCAHVCQEYYTNGHI